MKENKPYRFTSLHYLLIILLVLIFMDGLALWFTARTDYHYTVGRTKAILEKSSLSLEERMKRTVIGTDAVLQTLAERIRSGAMREGKTSAQEWERLVKIASGLPDKGFLVLIDKNGNLILHSEKYPSPRVYYSEREYFKAHSEKRAEFYIGPIVKGKVSNKYNFTISRPVTGKNGEFLGVIVAAIETENYADFLDYLDIGKGSTVVVFRTDGTMILRQPMLIELLGKSFRDLEWFTMLSNGELSGTYEAAGVDGRRRLVAYRKITGLPLVAATTVPVESILESWRSRAKIYSAVSLAIFFSLIALAWLVRRTTLREEQQKSEELSNINLALQTEIGERKQMEEYSRHLASFPQLNPKPVIELSSSGQVKYRNPAVQKTLEDHGFKGDDCSPFWPKDLEDLLHALTQGKEDAFYREVTIKDSVFAETIQLIPQFNSMRIYAHDITARIRTEEALRQSEQQYRIMGETLPYGVWLVDANGRAIHVSQSYLDLIEMTLEEMQNFGWTRRLPPEDVGPTKEKWMHSVRTGEPWESEHRIFGPDGKYHVVLARALPVRDENGEITCWVGINLDIDERKTMEEELRKSRDELEYRVQERTVQLQEAYESLQLESKERQKAEDQLRQSQKMEAIGTLAGGIAHDFNNILAAILGFTEMAIDDVSDRSPAKDNLKNVLKSAMRARDLVKQILTFSRKTSYDRTPILLSPLVKETSQLLRATIPATIEIKLSITVTSDTVFAAPTEVQQILMNLGTNASLAMEERGGVLEISLTDIDFMPDSAFETEMASGEYVQLMVKDTGTGMTPDVMRRAFEPFFTTRELGMGTGMGLAVVYGIVTDLKGTITVESEPGIGSIFRVFLPKVKTEVKEDQPETLQIPTGTESILFVDDEDMLVEWARGTLEKLGYSATSLTDPARALTMFSSDPSRFDLVITDQSMPSMSGMQLARELLTIRPDIPIILCTGHSAIVSPEKAKKAGIKEFLMKPVTREELAKVVRRVIDDRRINRRREELRAGANETKKY
ncbi:MAG: response regulator [Syntrophorhabdaceae bacterium]